MAGDEKKPSTPGPVVVRKGHVKPPGPGATIEPPSKEVLAPLPPRAGDEKPRVPLWKRVAEGKASPAPSPAPRRPPPRGDRPRDRAERPDRRGRERPPRPRE